LSTTRRRFDRFEAPLHAMVHGGAFEHYAASSAMSAISAVPPD
jgi:hypothetical protein